MCSGVPQSSGLGPILFTAYVSPIGLLIELYGVSSTLYCPDRQFKCIYRPVGAMFSWITTKFCENDLLLNSDKSKVCFFSTRQKLWYDDKPSSIKVAGCCIDVCEKLKTLDVTLDSALTFENHINGVVRSCNFHIRALRHVRCHLSREVANTVSCSIVGTRIIVTLCSIARLKSTSTSFSAYRMNSRASWRIQVCEITALLISCVSCTGCLFGVGYPLKWELCVVMRIETTWQQWWCQQWQWQCAHRPLFWLQCRSSDTNILSTRMRQTSHPGKCL